MAEQEQAVRETELRTPEAIRSRELSRDAYVGLAEAGAQQLLLDSFADQMATLNADPARMLGDLEVVKTFGETAATVREDGDGLLLEANVPLRTENDAGELRKVDVDLVVARGGGFETKNALADLRIPASASEAISVGGKGLAIAAVGEASSASLLGEKNVFYPEVQRDTDLLVAPIAAGVELFDQLRSAGSPEELHFDLDLPDGAQLQPNGGGGADVISDGKAIAYVAPPSAVDAQGTNVPVSLDSEGARITLRVPHREGDFAYPILVDPEVVVENFENSWYSGYGLEALQSGIWDLGTNDPTQTYTLRDYKCISGSPLCAPSTRGLYITSIKGNIPANTYAQWYYTVPGGTTYIPSIPNTLSAVLNPFWRNNESCSASSYPQPHDYDGSFDAGGNWQWLETDRAQWYGNAGMVTKAKGIAFGLGTGGSAVNIPCRRHIMLGGTVIRLDDPEAPALSSVTGFPSGWISATQAFSVTANISDPGLGVRNVTISPGGSPTIYYTSPGSECAGIKIQPCPASRAAQFNLSPAQFDEGEKTVQVSGEDPTKKVSSTYSTTLRVDRTPPAVTLGGQLAVMTDEDEGEEKDPGKWDGLPLPVYNLTIEAKDGSAAEPGAKRSGVKSIELFLDGKPAPEKSWTQSCPASSCAMTQSYALSLTGLALGKHVLKVVAEDQLDQPRIREIEFEYIPATGIKDEYVMHFFPLPDGEGNEAEEEHPDRPELAVNVMNGNLAYRETDIDIEGASAADLEVERYYNSQLPEAQNTEWGDGWTLADAPDLSPEDTGGSPEADQAEFVDASGSVEGEVPLPSGTTVKRFDPELQATLKKKTGGGGYEMVDETGEEPMTVAFDEGGQAEALLTEGDAKVDYTYEGGDLAEIEVEDPGTFAADPSELYNPISQPPTYKSSFGSSGTGTGQFNRPGDVTRDAAGNIFVVDQNNNRVQKFNAAGTYVSKFGFAGSGNGAFKRPTAIAVDPSGNLWVADSENHRIQKFKANGEFIAKYGSFGTANGQFKYPEGIAVDAKGYVWVSDTENGRLQKFTEAGAFVKAVGTKGSGSGQLGLPAALDIAPNGDVFVADWENNRVSVFSESGTFVRQFGSSGSGQGQFNHADSIDVDADGDVWVGDEADRVQHFDALGSFIEEIGAPGSGPGQFNFSYATGLTVDTEGNLWIADTNNHRVQKWELGGTTVQELAAGPKLITKPTYKSSFGSSGSAIGKFNRPGDVTRDTAGNLWVADQGNNRIQKFSAEGEALLGFTGSFSRPTAIAIDLGGNLWVADSENHRIQKFKANGEFIAKYGSFGTANGQFKYPEGIAVDAKGYVWVSDTENGRLQKFTEAGAFVKAVGTKGSGSGQLGLPAALDIAPNGDVFVADWENNRVSVFSESGTFVRQFGSTGTGQGQFTHADSLDVDAQGDVWVGDEAEHIQRFTQAGTYIEGFGVTGSDPGQFKLSYASGLAADSEGNLWIADTDNHRVQKWWVPSEKTTFVNSFNNSGVTGGLFTKPTDVAIGVEGNIWVGDEGTNRIRKFTPDGDKQIGSFGGAGQGDGKFSRPAAITIDRDGSLWVADAKNHRIQKFDSSGNFIAAFGTFGEGQGQFNTPEGILADGRGSIWVSDGGNGRLQRFDEEGKFIEFVGSKGSGTGQLGEPGGMDVDPEGNVWVADWVNARVVVFDSDGDFLLQFGSYGSGPGQFIQPDEVQIDNQGNVWVADQENCRVQRFSLTAEYKGQFGTPGTGAGQFEFGFPIGIAADEKGRLWVTDTHNARVQRWQHGKYELPAEPEIDLSDGDPKVEIETPGGLVSSVEGNAAGDHAYTHSGNDLTSHDGPAGETKYEYDASGHMTKVTLPNGTWGEIKYFADERVKSVTVDPAGAPAAKTTSFEYSDNPRRTVVTPPGAPHITYDIGADGSVLKWWNAAAPPDFDDLSGSLYANKETASPINTGDHNFIVQAHSEEGVASIQVIANGNQLVDEKLCEQDPGKSGVECVEVPNEWVTETGDWASGILTLEVILTDRIGNSVSQRFWVNIPYTPPPAPGAIAPPKFSDILKFREDFGLDLDLDPVEDEFKLNDRIFDLIGAWHNPQTPAGEVARASWERWGVPLRPVDVAELEYRESYIDTNADLIEEWGSANYPSTYAGYYVDHRAGGIFYVGFTQDQSARLSGMKASLALAAPDRLAVYPALPSTPRSSLVSTYETLDAALESNSALRNLVTELSINKSGNNISIGATNVSQTNSMVQELVGPNSPISIHQASEPILLSGRNRTSGRMRAGDRIVGASSGCTAGFGAFEERFEKETGQRIWKRFLLSAGHCFLLDANVYRQETNLDLWDDDTYQLIGHVTRNPFIWGGGMDALTVGVKPDLVPRGIFGSSGNLVPTGLPAKSQTGNTLCYSGAKLNGVSCGEVLGTATIDPKGVVMGGYIVKFKRKPDHGDSGSPVWNPRTGASVGLATAIFPNSPYAFVTPLLHPKATRFSVATGILNEPEMAEVQIIAG